MDLSPVYQAEPFLLCGLAVVLVGLVCPQRFRGVVTRTGAVFIGLVLLAAGAYVGLSVATQVWDRNPEHAYVGLIVAAGIAYLLTEQRRRKPLPVNDDDDDDDGGLRVHRPEPPEPVTPPPNVVPDLPPATDWGDFDDLRRGWEREREPAGV